MFPVGLCLTIFYTLNKVWADTLFDIEQSSVVGNLSVRAFLDDNYYIRLNISWGEVWNSSAVVSIRFQNDENCNQINDLEEFVMKDNSFVIVPSMEMEHPADNLVHGCEYGIYVENAITSSVCQNLTYKVPECVERKCECQDVRNSPYKLSSIQYLEKDVYSINWNKLTEHNLTVHEIYYQRLNSSLRTYIPESNITNNNDGIDVPVPDLIENISYRFTVKFLDVFNECIYFSSISLSATQTHKPLQFVVFGILAAFILILSTMYLILRQSPKFRNKLSKHIFCLRPQFLGTQNNVYYRRSSVLDANHRQELNAQYTPLEFVLNAHKFDEYEIPRNKIILEKQIGGGAFGIVFSGKVYGIDAFVGFREAAIKQLTEFASPEEITDFRNEIAILKKVGTHENIVQLFGCVTIEEPYLLVMELVPCGSLKTYLLTLRDKWKKRKEVNVFFPENSDSSYVEPDEILIESQNDALLTPSKESEELEIKPMPSQKEITRFLQYSPLTPTSITSSRLPSTTETEVTTINMEPDTASIKETSRLPKPVLSHIELQQFAFQISKGMSYLENIKIAHRDLAARNILISNEKILKISDFGLSRTGPYVSNKSKKLPLRWMAIEAIEERTCDSKSDVWSFGIVLWEIGTLGAFPYEKTPDTLVLHHLKQGARLERPKIIIEELWNLMQKCWKENPQERPFFHEIMASLDVNKKKVYVDFSEISPKYMFPPADEMTEEVSGQTS